MTRGRQAVLAILLVSTLVLAGCVAPDLQEWSPDGIEVVLDEGNGTATMSTHVGELKLENDVVSLLGCDAVGNFSAEPQNTDQKVKIEGWLHLSQHFPNGAITNSKGEMMSASAVIIELKEYDKVVRPTKGKVDGVKWHTPSYGVQARPPGYTSSSNFPQMGWAVVGLIPANENILKGFGGLDWHQKIRLEGWLLNGTYMGDNEIHVSDDGECRVFAGARLDGFAGTMLVTSMTLGDHGEIDATNSYNAYSVPIIGSWIYYLSLFAAVGGAVFLFFAISGLIRRGAKISARELMTEAQMIAAKGVKKEVKRDMLRIKSETGEKIKIKASKAQVIEAETRSQKPVIELDEFDVEGAMRAGQRPSAHSVRSASSGGVVETEESVDMQDQLAEFDAMRELESTIESRRRVLPGGPMVMPDDDEDEPTSGMVMSRTEIEEPEPKVRKTRAVKKQPEPETKPKPPTKSGPDIADDEDFSDFAL